MISLGFHVDTWYIEVYYDIMSDEDLLKVSKTLSKFGCEDNLSNLLRLRNTGYTFTNFNRQVTVILISHTTSPEQMYDTIQHELKHVVEHISEYYHVDPKSEAAAYLQGEIARLMFPAAAMVVCPRYHK